VTVQPLLAEHWGQVRAIYEEGIRTGNATFESAAPSWQDWDARHLAVHRLVAIGEGGVLGWAALLPVSSRSAYRGVCELSVYVAASAAGQGVGSALMGTLIRDSEQAGIWTLQASIFPENISSIALHRKFGFREVGRRERIAQLAGIWRDTFLFERRSRVAGLE
jgi:L-amino acid N-acyltransferase YncA